MSAAAEFSATPLAPRSGPAAATLFVAQPASATGIVAENRYADPEFWGKYFDVFKFGAIGTGIAVGDFDNDGRPDLFIVSKTETSRLFRNLGNWKFQDVTEKAGLTPSSGWIGAAKNWVGLGAGDETLTRWRQGAAFADIDNDGHLDLYVCRFNAPNLLYVNQGDGTFKEEAAARGLAVADASGMGAFCDYDRDGWLDVYLQTNLLDNVASPEGQPDRLFRNNGDGTFSDVTARAGIRGKTQGHAAIWWDYDEDGWPDLYVANDFAPADSLYHNNRDGTFTNTLDQVLPRTPHSSMGADLGDVNNDGRIDLLVADMAATTAEKDQRGMAKIRTLLATMPEHEPHAAQFMRNALYLNTGVGRMREAAPLAGLAATDWTWSVLLEDLDCDGRVDAHFTNGMVRELHNADLQQRVSSLETLAEKIQAEKSTPPLAEQNLAYRNLGDFRFENTSRAWGLDQKGVSFGAAFADLDGDGDLDLVFSNYEAPPTVLRNDAVSGHRLLVALRGTRSNRFGLGATIRIESASGEQVRPLVSARGYLSSGEPVAHFGLGEDSTIRRLTVEWPSGHRQVFSDIAVDQRITITEPAALPSPRDSPPASSAAFVEIGERMGLNTRVAEDTPVDASPQHFAPFRFDRRGPALVVSDLNGDARADVLVGGSAREPAQLLLAAEGRHTRAPLATERSTLDDGPWLAFDADADGDADLLQTKGGANLPAGAPEYQPTLYLNDGQAGFRRASPDTLPPAPISVGAAIAADFDRDGGLDVFLGGRVRPGRYPAAPRSALLAQRQGRFEDVTDVQASGLREVGQVSSALWTDVDGDGWLDLLLALEWGGVRYFHNQAGRGFADESERAGFAAAGSGWWTALAAADFNGDGRVDYVAGNAGLNTPYRATPEEPALILLGDFRGSGPPLLVEGRYENGKLFPWRSRNELAVRLPAVGRRFPRHDAYARATLAELLGAEKIAAAERFAATELQSGVFLSQRDGTFRFTALPRITQVAPVQGVAVGDFDGDGHTDIYALQNSHAPIPQIGRFDGGLSQLLRGDGTGRFEAVEPATSGLVVPGDAKALALSDLNADGWADFIATRNDAPAMAYQNRGHKNRRGFAVTLRGSTGNRTAAGARITVTLRDGASQTGEIHYGSGYYSQTSPACWFGFPDSNPPTKIRVRWPSGITSEHPLNELPPPLLTLAGPQS